MACGGRREDLGFHPSEAGLLWAEAGPDLTQALAVAL